MKENINIPFEDSTKVDKKLVFSEYDLDHLIGNGIKALDYICKNGCKKDKIDAFIRIRGLIGSQREVLVRNSFPYMGDYDDFKNRDKVTLLSVDNHKELLVAMLDLEENHVYVSGKRWTNESTVK